MASDEAVLNRILLAQALEFPKLATLAYEEGWLRAVRAIATLLKVFAAADRIRIEDPEIAANLFLNLVLGRAMRLALYGIAVDPHAQERRRRFAVGLYGRSDEPQIIAHWSHDFRAEVGTPRVQSASRFAEQSEDPCTEQCGNYCAEFADVEF
jgi:hypothetical protein